MRRWVLWQLVRVGATVAAAWTIQQTAAAGGQWVSLQLLLVGFIAGIVLMRLWLPPAP